MAPPHGEKRRQKFVRTTTSKWCVFNSEVRLVRIKLKVSAIKNTDCGMYSACHELVMKTCGQSKLCMYSSRAVEAMRIIRMNYPLTPKLTGCKVDA